MESESVEAVFAAYAEVGIRCVFSLQVGDVHGAKVTPFWEEVLPQAVHGDLSGVVSSDEEADLLVARLAAFHRRVYGECGTGARGVGPPGPRAPNPARLPGVSPRAATRALPGLSHRLWRPPQPFI